MSESREVAKAVWWAWMVGYLTITAECEAMTPEQREEHKFTGSLIPLVDPVFQPLLTNPTLMKALESMGFGTDVTWSCGFIISKPPGGPSLAWQ